MITGCVTIDGRQGSELVVREVQVSQLRTTPGFSDTESDFIIDKLTVRIHFIIVMIRWTGLAPWEFEFPFPGSITSTFMCTPHTMDQGSVFSVQ